MSQDYPERQGSSRTVVWVIVIVAAVIVAALLVCAGVGYLAVKALQQVAASAKDLMQDMQSAQVLGPDFLSDLKADRIDAAYARTSASYQKEWSPQAFRDFLKKHPLLTKHTSATMQDFQFTPPNATERFNLVGPSSTETCTLVIIKEGEQWKIHQLTVP
jgi:hypothetical protein